MISNRIQLAESDLKMIVKSILNFKKNNFIINEDTNVPSAQKALSLVEALNSLNKEISGLGIRISIAYGQRSSWTNGSYFVAFWCDLKNEDGGSLEDPRDLDSLSNVVLGLDKNIIPYGAVDFGPTDDFTGPCGNSWTIHNSAAKAGWGILLYELALEISSDIGGGLRAGTSSVTPSAAKVWEKYLTRAQSSGGLRKIDTSVPYDSRQPANGPNSSDVTAFQLDDLSNLLTPQAIDNCEPTSSKTHIKSLNKAKKNYLFKTFGHDKDFEGVEWQDSALNFRYFKKNKNILNALKFKNLLKIEQ
jgi:hypothetical protein